MAVRPPGTPPPHKILKASPIAVSFSEQVGKNTTRQLSDQELLKTFVSVSPAVQVTSGPLQINVQADASSGQAVVTVLLMGTQLLCKLLSFTNPVLALDVAVQDCVAKGSISLHLLTAPDYCSVNTQVIATQAKVDYPLQGMICSWLATAEPVVGVYSTILTSELTTLTTVRSAAANYAEFGFYFLGTLMAQAVATQFAPVQIFYDMIGDAGVKIDPGAQITLSIPSSLAPGWLFLQATFSSATTPSTRISSSVANWTLPLLDYSSLQEPGVCADDERAVLPSILCKPTL